MQCITLANKVTQLSQGLPEVKKTPVHRSPGRTIPRDASIPEARWREFSRQGVGNLQATKLGLRPALLKDGRRLLQGLLESNTLNIPDNACRPGEKCHSHRPILVDTLFGSIKLLERSQQFSLCSGTSSSF